MSDLGDSIRRAQGKPLKDAIERAQQRIKPRREEEQARRLVWQGPWNRLVRYKIGDVVEHLGSSWRAIAPNIDSEPPSPRWELVAQKGETGPAGFGNTGPEGPPGPQGPAGSGGTPATTVTDETTFGITPAVGAGTAFARDDHTHGSPGDPVPAHAALADVHHAKSHIHDGADGSGVVSHAALTNVTADQHHATDHDHDGSPTQQLVQANTHQSPDTDAATTSLHHTIGTGATQAAAGNHDHDEGDLVPDTVTIEEFLRLTGVITSAATGTQDDFSPTGWPNASIIRLTNSPTLTGLVAGQEGQVVVLQSTNLLTLKDENAGSAAANRFELRSDVEVRPGDAVVLIYDTAASRWRASASTTLTDPATPSDLTENGSGGLVGGMASRADHAHRSPYFSLSVSTADSSVSNSTLETSFISVDRTWEVGDILEFEMSGTYVNSSATARYLKFRIKLGATTILEPVASPAVFGGTSASARKWVCRGRLYLKDDTTVRADMTIDVSNAGAGDLMEVGGNAPWAGSTGDKTVTSLSAGLQTFAVTVQHETALSTITVTRQTAALHLIRV